MKYKNFYITMVALGLFSNLFSSGKQISKQALNDELIALIKANAPASEIQSLLNKGADPNFRILNQKVDPEILRKVLQPNQDVRITPLAIAVTNLNKGIVETLLKAGANPNSKITEPNSMGGFKDVSALYFLHESTNMKKENPITTEIIELFLAYGAKIENKEEGGILLRYAIKFGNENMVKNLLKAGVQADRQLDNDTAKDGSYIVKAIKAPNRNINIIAALLDAGVDINRIYPSYGPGSHTALEAAVRIGDVNVIQMLLNRGANPLLENKSSDPLYIVTGKEVLQQAEKTENPEIIKLFMPWMDK